MRKTKSVPISLYTLNIHSSKSFHDYASLFLQGNQKHLTLGEYSQIPSSSKEKKRKIIAYFYRKMRSRL